MKWWLGSAALLLAGFIFELGLLVYATYALLGALLVSRYLARRWINSIVCSRQLSAAAAELGETVQVEITMTNPGPVGITWLLCEDFLPREPLARHPPDLEVKGARLALLHLKAGGEKKLSYSLRCRRRGYYQIGPLLFETGDLFGLHRRYRIGVEPAYLMVLPRHLPMEDYDLLSPRPLGEIRVTHRLFEDPTLIAGIKPYEPGQSLNRIHWRATARTGELQSKIFQPSTVTGITVLLDFHQDRYSGNGGLFREDLAIVTAASLAGSLLRLGQRFGLVSNGRDAAARIREQGWRSAFQTRAEAQAEAAQAGESEQGELVTLPPAKGEAHFQALLEMLARLELSDLPLAEMVSLFSSHLSRSTTIVAVLSDVDTEAALALGGLRQRGFEVAAAVIVFDEPAISDWAALPDWARLLQEQGIPFHRIENDETLRQFCSAVLAPP